MKRIATLQCIWIATWVACAQAQDAKSVATNTTPAAQTLPRPAVTAASTGVPTNAVEVQTEPDAPLFEGRALDLFGIKPDWKTAAQPSTVSGPLVDPFLSKSAAIPRRVLDLINPFAPMQAPPATVHKSTVKGLSSRSWASVVGWRPGRSEFAEVTTHEPSSALITIQCSTEGSRR